jgi:predicted O-linked N-acetylglucosamine transferase (SPINDLY family)
MSTDAGAVTLGQAFAEAGALAEAGRLIDALDRYTELLAAHPRVPELHFNRAVLLAQLGRNDEAEAGMHAAAELRPKWPAPPLALGHLFFQQRRHEDAARMFAAAVALAPDSIEALTNVGVALTELRRPEQALPPLRRARALAPDSEHVWYELRKALVLDNRELEALADFQRFEAAAAPTARLISVGLSSSRLVPGEDVERKYLARALEWNYSDEDLNALPSTFSRLQYHDVAQADLLRLYRRFDEAMQVTRPERMDLAQTPASPPPLRVGYLSADFRDHVMGRIMRDVIARHDRSRVLPFLYSLAPANQSDAITEALRAGAAGFADLEPLSEEEGAARIADDRLHVLVDLMVHTTWSRVGLLVHKPAPVIVTHLGHHGAVGLRQVDFKVTDAHTDLPDAGDWQLERPLPMAVPIIPLRRVAASGEPPPRWPDATVTFGAFANLAKLSPRCLRAWAAVIAAVPGSVLVFSPYREWEREIYVSRCVSFGIDPARVRFIPATMNEPLDRARYRMLDVALDAFPYTGGDSCATALAEGVPFVTLRGTRHAERVAASILTHLGVTETIADSDQAFVGIATRLALDRPWRSFVVEKIRAARPADNDAAMTPYTRALEDALWTAWQERGPEPGH